MAAKVGTTWPELLVALEIIPVVFSAEGVVGVSALGVVSTTELKMLKGKTYCQPESGGPGKGW